MTLLIFLKVPLCYLKVGYGKSKVTSDMNSAILKSREDRRSCLDYSGKLGADCYNFGRESRTCLHCITYMREREESGPQGFKLSNRYRGGGLNLDRQSCAWEIRSSVSERLRLRSKLVMYTSRDQVDVWLNESRE